jgi:hypothetical protein
MFEHGLTATGLRVRDQRGLVDDKGLSMQRRATVPFRPLALALSFILVAGTLALPAFASGLYTFAAEIGAQAEGVEGTDDTARPFAFDLRLANTSEEDRILGSANVTVPAGIFVTDASPYKLNKKNRQIIEYRELKIRPGEEESFTFAGTVDCSDGGSLADAATFEVVAKASADFGGRGLLLDDGSLEGKLTLFRSVLCPGPDVDSLVAPDGSIISFSVDLDEYFARYDIFDSEDLDDETPVEVRTVNEGCGDLLEAVTPGNSKRLSNFLVYLVPKAKEELPLDADEVIALTYFIPAEVVERGTPTSAQSYEVCFAGEELDEGGEPVFDGGTPLFEKPRFLDACTRARRSEVIQNAPCVDARRKNSDGDVEIVFVIPATDPIMR